MIDKASSLLNMYSSEPTATTLVLSVFLIIIPLILRRRKQPDERNWPKVPGARPILGNDFGGIGNFLSQLNEWAEMYGKEKGIYECNIMGKRIIAICSEEKAAMIESKRPFLMTRNKRIRPVIKSLGGDGLFSAEGEDWKHDRKMVGPLLNHKHVKDYLPTVKHVSQRLVDKWVKTMEEDGVVSINSSVLALTFDIISKVGFGMDLDSVTRGDTPEGNDIKTIFKAAVFRILCPIPFWKIPVIGKYLDGCGGARQRHLNLLNKRVQDYEKEEEALSSSSDQARENHEESGTRNTFLKKVIAQNKKDSRKLNRERLVGNLSTLLMAGSDTSQVTIVSSLYEIAKDNTGLQDELAAESLALGNLEDATMDDIYKKLPRMRSLMYEILRLKGPTAFVGLANQKALDIEGVLVPKGTKMYVLGQFISTQESTIPGKSTPRGPRDANLKSFCARRWLVDGKGKPSDVSNCSVLDPSFDEGFRPFGAGARVCPGRALGEVNVLVTLCRVLSKFRISLEENHPPMKLVLSFSLIPDVDIRLILEPRIISHQS